MRRDPLPFLTPNHLKPLPLNKTHLDILERRELGGLFAIDRRLIVEEGQGHTEPLTPISAQPLIKAGVRHSQLLRHASPPIPTLLPRAGDRRVDGA